MILKKAEYYHEDFGDVLWFHFDSFEEPPEVYCGTCLDSEFTEQFWTHFAELDLNDIIKQAKHKI